MSTRLEDVQKDLKEHLSRCPKCILAMAPVCHMGLYYVDRLEVIQLTADTAASDEAMR